MKKHLTFLFILSFVFQLKAQTIDTLYESVFFDFDQSNLKLEEVEKLNQFLLKGKPLTIYIEANTDARGSNDYNLKLGNKRANTIQDYFLQQGIDVSILNIINYGEAHPVDKKEDETSFAKNRRVDITAIYEKNIPEPKITIQEPIVIAEPRKDTNSIDLIYKKLALEPEVFLIEKKDTVLTTKRGTILIIDEKDISCSCKKGSKAIRIELKEIYKKSEIFRERLSTLTVDGQILESGGMIHFDVFCNNKKTWLSKPIDIMVPTRNYKAGMRLYTAQTNTTQLTGNQNNLSRTDMLWTLNTRSNNSINNAYDWMNNNGYRENGRCLSNPILGGKKDKFNLWQWLRSIFAKPKFNRQERELVKKLKKEVRHFKQASKIEDAIKNVKSNKKHCNTLTDFYAFGTLNTGFLNVDKPYPNNQLIDVKINTAVSSALDLMLILNQNNVSVAAQEEEKKFKFSVPKKLAATLIGLKIADNGKILFGLKKVTTRKGSFNLKLEPYKLKDIKRRLKRLDSSCDF